MMVLVAGCSEESFSFPKYSGRVKHEESDLSALAFLVGQGQWLLPFTVKGLPGPTNKRLREA